MSNKQETIADIVTDIRAQNQGLPEDSYALSPLVCDLLSFADRIEAAAKREREATREKSSQVGNAQEMRNALVAMVEAETGGTMERDYLCGRCLERLFDRCKHDGSCWVDKVMNALAEAKGEAK